MIQYLRLDIMGPYNLALTEEFSIVMEAEVTEESFKERRLRDYESQIYPGAILITLNCNEYICGGSHNGTGRAHTSITRAKGKREISAADSSDRQALIPTGEGKDSKQYTPSRDTEGATPPPAPPTPQQPLPPASPKIPDTEKKAPTTQARSIVIHMAPTKYKPG